jgi:citronellol/citronellal dehydrogenase
VLPSVIEHKRGSLIAITATGVLQTELGSNAYRVSKAGIERYYAGLAAELAPLRRRGQWPGTAPGRHD